MYVKATKQRNDASDDDSDDCDDGGENDDGNESYIIGNDNDDVDAKNRAFIN